MDLHERRRAVAERLRSGLAIEREPLREGFDPRRWPAWAVGIALVAVPSQVLAAWRLYADLPAGTRPPLRDSIIFQYIGWYLSRGGRLYVDVWELKPPLPYELTALLSILAGGDPVVAHWLNVTLTATAAVGVALAAGLLVADVTGDATAAFAAGVALYVLPAYHWRAAFGFKVKYFVPLFALLAIYLARRDRPVWAGVLAAGAAGFWQLAVAVPAIVAGIAYDRAGRHGLGRMAVGVAAVLVVGLLPVVHWGALEAMLTEVILVPLLLAGELGAASPIARAVALLGPAIPVALLGAAGVVVAARRRFGETWWLAAGTAWFGVQALVVDLDSSPDLFPVVAFLAVGVGLLLGLETGRQRPAAALLMLLAVTSVVTMGAFGTGDGPLREPGPTVYEPDRELTLPYTETETAHLYWRGDHPAGCRVFYGPTQFRLVRLAGGGPLQETCGDAEPVLDAIGAKWFGG